MAYYKIEELSKKWFARSQEAEDEFDKFFALWIALIIAAKNYLRNYNYSAAKPQLETDRELVIFFFDKNTKNILKVLETRSDLLSRLCQRKGPRHQQPIVDASKETNEKLQKLCTYYEDGTSMEAAERVEAVAELFNKVRNNLFHGEKDYNDEADISLLRSINPLMEAILMGCAPYLTR